MSFVISVGRESVCLDSLEESLNECAENGFEGLTKEELAHACLFLIRAIKSLDADQPIGGVRR